MERSGLKRSRSQSPPPWRRQPKSPRQRYDNSRGQRDHGFSGGRAGIEGQGRAAFPRDYARRNHDHENAQMREWVSKEDEFVLKQSRKKAKIRVRDGRAKPIDWLVAVLTIADEEKDLLADEDDDAELDVKDPEAVIEEVPVADLPELVREIDYYLVLESNDRSCVYWQSLKTVCKKRQQLSGPSDFGGRGMNAVSEDVDRLLGPKSLEQLRGLEGQVHAKLQSNEPIDEEYWEQLLDNIKVYQSKAQLKDFYRAVVEARLNQVATQQIREARRMCRSLHRETDEMNSTKGVVEYSNDLEPESMLKISAEDKKLEVLDEADFLARTSAARAKVEKLSYIPTQHQRKQGKQLVAQTLKPSQEEGLSNARFAASTTEDFSQATNALYNREVARGVDEDEEVFAGEEEVSTASKSQWANKYRPRKPRYFNRVQMGYEWNKYNQTHYDHDNPPPKVVQGYKFNVFYPDLIDNTRAPTYRIEREHGRKKGQSFAPAGEEDTCLIRFMSGPPYEDVAFRIVDKEWDYSAKRDRGFRSSFDKGILQLHFQFKKVYYRK